MKIIRGYLDFAYSCIRSLSLSLRLALLVCLDPEQGDIRPDLVLPLFCPRHVEISIPRRGCYPIKSGRGGLFLGDFAPFIPEVILHSRPRSDRLSSDVSRAWTACYFHDRAIVCTWKTALLTTGKRRWRLKRFVLVWIVRRWVYMLMTAMAWHFHAEGSRGRFVGTFPVSSLQYL